MNTSTENKPLFGSDHRDVIELAAKTNVLLHALMGHPQINRSNPAASPKPLFFATDFVRRTYLEYIMPLLPKDAEYNSSVIANGFVFAYAPRNPTKPPMPEPEDGGPSDDSWLLDVNNWPTDRGSAKYLERFRDAFSRTHMVAMAILDPSKGAFVLGGQFDWENPVPVKELAAKIVGS